MKKYLTIITAALAFQAHACDVTYNSASEVANKVLNKNGWGFKNYEKICAKLKKANAALVIEGDATVLGNKSIAWASVTLKDLNTMIFTNEYAGLSTQTNDYASVDKAETLLMTAINNAVETVNFDMAIQSLNESRKKVREAYSR